MQLICRVFSACLYWASWVVGSEVWLSSIAQGGDDLRRRELRRIDHAEVAAVAGVGAEAGDEDLGQARRVLGGGDEVVPGDARHVLAVGGRGGRSGAQRDGVDAAFHADGT